MMDCSKPPSGETIVATGVTMCLRKPRSGETNLATGVSPWKSEVFKVQPRRGGTGSLGLCRPYGTDSHWISHSTGSRPWLKGVTPLRGWLTPVAKGYFAATRLAALHKLAQNRNGQRFLSALFAVRLVYRLRRPVL